MSLRKKQAGKRLKAALKKNFETKANTIQAGPLGSGQIYAAGQIYDASIDGVTEVVNIGRPAAAQYVARRGGGTTVVAAGGNSSTGSGVSGDYLALDGSTIMLGNLNMGGSDIVNIGLVDGVDISAHVGDPDAHHNQQHAILSADHTITGAKFTLVGATDTDTLGPITPTATPGASEQILKTDSSGQLTLPLLVASTSVTTPLIDTASGDLKIAPADDLWIDANVGIGTGTPSEMLHLYNASGDAGAEIEAQNGGDAYLRLTEGSGSYGFEFRYDGADNKLYLNAGTTEPYTTRVTFLRGSDGVGIGSGKTSPAYTLDVGGTIGADTSLTTPLVAATGNLEISPAGDLILDPVGNDVLPELNYDINLGAINKKYLTLHAAELWVETLVAQETIATIGGRILVGPTTTLEADLSTVATTITVKHNSLNDGDIVYMEADGKVEFMSIDSAYSGTGPYTYTVTRNLDGSGANQWYAGDAMFNTGQTSNGFIDIYSLYGIPRNGQTATNRAGPTIVGNVRLSSTYNDFRERWAVGSLNGLYDYSSEIYGFAAGDPTAVWVGLDATNGLRMMDDAQARMEITPAGVMNFINSAGVDVITLDNSGNSYFSGVMTIGTSGEIRQGTGTLATDFTGLRIWRDTNVGRIGGYNDDTLQWYADTDGKLYAGAGAVTLDADGITLAAGAVSYPSLANANKVTWTDGSDNVIAWLGATDPGSTTALLYAEDPSGASTNITLLAKAGASSNATITLQSTVDASSSQWDFIRLADGTQNASFPGKLTVNDLEPQTDLGGDVGTASKRYGTIYADQIVATTVSGATMSGAEWEYAGSMVIDANSASSTTVAVVNQGAGSVSMTVNGGTVWHSANDGPSSGLDADTLDGQHASAFLTSGDLAGYVQTTRTITAGSGLSGGGDLSANRTISHDDTSSQASVNNSGTTVIQDVTLDEFGHVTALASVDLATAFDSTYVNVTGDTMTGNLTVPQIVTSEIESSGSDNVTLDSATGIFYLQNSGTNRARLQSNATVFDIDQLGGSTDTSSIRLFRQTNTTGAKSLQLLSGDGGSTVVHRLAVNATTVFNNSNADIDWRVNSATTAALYVDAGNSYVGINRTSPTAQLDLNGSMILNGDIDGASWDMTAGGVLTAAANTNLVTTVGRVRLGYAAGSDTATFSHYDHNSAGDYALAQYGTGATEVNAVSGQYIDLSIDNTAIWTVNAERINPQSTNVIDVGDYNRKVRTLFASELYVETLVAQDVLATIGGRVMVAPTTKLIAAVTSIATTIDVEHNFLASGDFIYLSAAPSGVAQIEAMKVTTGPTTITGGYRYSVQRNKDGSNSPDTSGNWDLWQVGDAVVSLGGAVGEGYIDLTSTSTIHSHLGPTMTIYSRSATTNWDDVDPVVSIGNLRSFVDYASDKFGFAVGNDLTLTPTTGFSGMTGDTTNGLRMFNTDIELYESGNIYLSMTANDGIVIETDDSALNNAHAITFESGGDLRTYMKGHEDTFKNYFQIVSGVATGKDTWQQFSANGASGRFARIDFITYQIDAGQSNTLTLHNATTGAASYISGESDGEIRWIAPDIELTGDLLITGDTTHAGTLGIVSGDLNVAGDVTISFATLSMNNSTMASDLDLNGNDITDIGSIGNAWTGVTFATGWANYAGHQAGQYKKFGDFIKLRGMVYRASGSSSTILTLPAGYRIADSEYFAVQTDTGIGYVRVRSDGAVVHQGGGVGWVSLSNVLFSINS